MSAVSCRDGVATILDAVWAVTPERRMEMAGELLARVSSRCGRPLAKRWILLFSLVQFLTVAPLDQGARSERSADGWGSPREGRYRSPGKDSSRENSRQFHNRALRK
jgi:hypothetical protein